MLQIPSDIIYKILTHISDPASLVWAASSCRLWHNIIMSPTFLDGLKMQHLGHGFAPSLLLGFFYQDNTHAARLWQCYIEKCYSLEPSFMPTSLLLQSTGQGEGHNAVRPLSLGTFIEGFVASLNFYEPIVSQDGFLVLCHRSRDPATIPDVVRVCNPLTGEVFHIPDLIHRPQTDNYVLLVTDYVSLDRQMSRSFRLVAVWTTGNKIFYSYYCSKTRSWWKPSTSQIMPGLFVVSSSASAGHGCIHWLCGNFKSSTVTHVVTLHVDGEELSHLELPSEAKGKKLLANSADGGILLLILKDLQMSLWKHESESSNNWVLSQVIDMADYLPINNTVLHSRAKVTLEIFQGKSGAVVLWVEKEGLFLFSLSD